MKAREIALQAAELVGGDRHLQHGDKHQNFGNIARLWAAYLENKFVTTGHVLPVTPLDVANLMELMKIARRQSGSHNPDDYVDGAGYAACAGEIAEHLDAIMRLRHAQTDTDQA